MDATITTIPTNHYFFFIKRGLNESGMAKNESAVRVKWIFLYLSTLELEEKILMKIVTKKKKISSVQSSFWERIFSVKCDHSDVNLLFGLIIMNISTFQLIAFKSTFIQTDLLCQRFAIAY